ncbi:MAG: hypothetical protein PHQ98_02540 [Candidatus ainarchaeum sp.]|nr:hypothetical protein [Candidatus ainarchaeum sp.]
MSKNKQLNFLENSLIKGFFIGFLLIILLFSNPAFAYSIESNNYQRLNFDSTATGSAIVSTDSSSSTDSSLTSSTPSALSTSNCDVVDLTDNEAQSLIDLTKDGFSGNSIGDAVDEKANGVDLNGSKLVAADNDGKTAIELSPPTKAASADRFKIFDGRTLRGPFGLGLVLDDTLRVGVCDYSTSDQSNCRINGNGLNYRSAGETGFVSSVTNLLPVLSDSAAKTALNLTDEQVETMQNSVTDSNTLEAKVVSQTAGEKINNVLQTSSYAGRSATTCNNTNCSISLYSTFDKFYNQWFSGEMVVSSFGPTLLSGLGNKLGILKRAQDNGGVASKISSFFDKYTDKAKLSTLPSQLLGIKSGKNYKRLVSENSLNEFFSKLIDEKKIFGGSAYGVVDDLIKPDGALMKLSPERKKKFFEALTELKKYAAASNEQMVGLKTAYGDALKVATTTKMKDAAKIDYAKGVVSNILDWDDIISLDYPNFVQSNQELLALGGYAVNRKDLAGITGVVPFNTPNGYEWTDILKPFSDSGSWAGSKFETVADGSLQLYKLFPSEFKVRSSVADLQANLAKYGDGVYSVFVPGKDYMPLNAATLDYINSAGIGGSTFDVFSSTWAKVPSIEPLSVLTPEDFASRMTQGRIPGRTNNINNVLDQLTTNLKQNPDFVQRNSLNYLDKMFATEKDLFKKYYSFNVKDPAFIKLFAGPYAYWNIKRGLGNEEFSAYMLPDSWSTISFAPGEDAIYADSYSDFYANEGSDQGDLFSNVMNSILFAPNYILKEALMEKFPEMEFIKKYTGEYGLGGEKILRNEVYDLAFYSHNENCVDCTVPITYTPEGYLSFGVSSFSTNLNAYMLEAADAATKQEDGTSLIVYTHKTNITGKTTDIEGQEINLVDARKESTTCDDALRKIGLGFAGAKTAGLILAGGESLAYVLAPGMGGVLATVAQQLLIAPELQDCVDDQEGYYIHFFDPADEVKASADTKEKISNETVTNTLSDMADKLSDAVSDSNNPLSESLSNMTNEFKDFMNKSKQNNILQANLSMFAPISGNLQGKELFYVWSKDGLMPSGLKTEGKELIKDGNNEVLIDYGAGSLSINGKDVIQNKKDIVGLITNDLRIPAEVVPAKVTTISAPNTKDTVFELNSSGEITILQNDVLKCIQGAVYDQVGIEFNGNELTSVFGKLKLASTKNYQSIFVKEGKIYLEGTSPRYQGGTESKLIVDGYWDSRLTDENKLIDGGKFVSFTFDNGSIVINEETNQLVVWLRHHEQSILSNNEVEGLNVIAKSTVNPETGCTEPALQLEAVANQKDDLGKQKVDNFNTSMEHLGPFTQFTTTDKIYIFYSKLDDKGICKDYFKIIDKDTGKVLVDSEIVGDIAKADDGSIVFSTADGQQHNLKFDAENGVPKVSYNGGPLETLLSAQGTKGSFWYDPETGTWYPENGIQIPLDSSYKDNGLLYSVDKDGNITGTATNPMTFNIGQGSTGGLNIPSLPEDLLSLFIFISLFLMVSFNLTNSKIKLKK